MTPPTIGILHPGEMGVSLAASAQRSGHPVLWASSGRSDATRTRAAEFGLHDAHTIEGVGARSEIMVGICPPHAAEALAREVLDARFEGVYVDANAIAPERARGLARTLADEGVELVDGAVIGPPAWTPGTTCLYLSGARAAEVAALFEAGPLAVHVLGDRVGTASALKMCYAAYAKGTTALLAAVLAVAQRAGVRDALEARWDGDDPGFAGRAHDRTRRVTRKAWRFAGEMEEIAATFAAAGAPAAFHEGAAELYRRLAGFKDAPAPALEAVLAASLEPEPAGEEFP